MSVGHGELGLRSGLRPFSELIRESACRKDAYLEIHGAATVTATWTADGDAWSIGWGKHFDGVLLDVVGVKTLTQVCQRVETVALCQSTEGTYCYNEDDDVGIGVLLHVHLIDDEDPNDVLVQARAGFFFGTSGQEASHLVHPQRGTNKLIDGGLNFWLSATNLTNWTETNTGAGWTTNQDSTIVYEGDSSARLQSTGAAIGNALLEQPQVCVVGKVYVFWGRYMTDVANPSTATLYARFGAATLLGSDGRTPTATDGAALANTGGQWRNFFFYVSAHEAAPDVGFMLKNTAASECQAWVDDVHFDRIYRWNYYEPRLQREGLPESSMGASDVYPGSEETGGGSITLANGASAYGSDYMERMFAPDFFFVGKPVQIWYGGAFQDGQEILDLERGGRFLIAGDRPFSVTDRQAVIEVEEPRTTLEQVLPTRTFDVSLMAGLAPKDKGRRRALLWGAKTNIRPTRISKDGTTLLGTYEVSDPTPAVNGALDSVQAVYAYTDEAAAAAKDTAKRVTLVVTTNYTVNLTTGQIAIVGNPGPFVVAPNTGAILDWMVGPNTGGAARVYLRGILAGGIYTAAGLATAVQTALGNSPNKPSGTVTVTYSNTTHKFTISWAAGAGTSNIALLTDTGQAKERSAWPLLGFEVAGSITIVTGVNDKIDFDIGAAELTATIAPGAYSPGQIASSLQTLMRAAAGGGGADITCVYEVPALSLSDTGIQHTIIGKAAGTLNLRCATGTNLATTAYKVLGFDCLANKTGSLNYIATYGVFDKAGSSTSQVSDVALFSDPDTQHVIRVDATGYKDTAAGAYTGTANAVIQRGSDVLRFVFVRVATDVVGGIDEASFIEARTSCSQPLAIYLGDDPMTVQDVIDRLEAGGFADIVLDGGGIVHFVHRDGSVPADAVSLFDRDYLEWEGYVVGDDAYGTVEVRYNQDPSTGDWLISTLTNDETVLLHSRPHTRTFDTFLRDEADAEDATAQLAVLARAPTRHFAFAIKGQLLKAKVGDIVLLSRDQSLRGFGQTGSLDLFEGRILHLKKNFLDHTVTAVVHTNVVI